MSSAQQTPLTAKFWAMHESGCFVLPNPWDIGTAIYLEDLGFEALATTSAGFAFSRGKRDGAVPRDEISQIVKTVAPKPVNVLVSGFNHQLSLSQLADLGVRRISVGSGLALAAWGTFLRAAQDIKTNGTFKLLANGAKTGDLNELFQEK